MKLFPLLPRHKEGWPRIPLRAYWRGCLEAYAIQIAEWLTGKTRWICPSCEGRGAFWTNDYRDKRLRLALCYICKGKKTLWLEPGQIKTYLDEPPPPDEPKGPGAQIFQIRDGTPWQN